MPLIQSPRAIEAFYDTIHGNRAAEEAMAFANKCRQHRIPLDTPIPNAAMSAVLTAYQIGAGPSAAGEADRAWKRARALCGVV